MSLKKISCGGLRKISCGGLKKINCKSFFHILLSNPEFSVIFSVVSTSSDSESE
jgi:hypothetical protein